VFLEIIISYTEIQVSIALRNQVHSPKVTLYFRVLG